MHRIREESTKFIDDIPSNVDTPEEYDIEEGDTVHVPQDYQDKFGRNGNVEKIASLFAIVSSNSNGKEYLFALDELEKLDDVDPSGYVIDDFEEGEKVEIVADGYERRKFVGRVDQIRPHSYPPIRVNRNGVREGFEPSELEKVEDSESSSENDEDSLFDVDGWKESNQKSVDHTPEISEGNEVEVVDDRSDFERLKGEVKHIDDDRYFEFGVELTFDSTHPVERRVVSFQRNEIELDEEEEYNEIFVYTDNYNQLKAYIDTGKEIGYRLPDNVKVDEDLSHVRFTPNGLIKVSSVQLWNPNVKKIYENIGLSKLRELLKNE